MMLDKGQIKDWDGEPEDPAEPKASAPKPVEAVGKPVAQAAPPEATETAAPAAVQPTAPEAAPVLPVFGEARATGETVHLSPQQEKARKRRGQWLALGLFAFVILVFVLTMTKMGAQILVRDL
jgi:hypothetical protein